ncbi:hypothetical protein T439DRAFT_380901 [Meredithblackwellia eburnea MCA 4105]
MTNKQLAQMSNEDFEDVLNQLGWWIKKREEHHNRNWTSYGSTVNARSETDEGRKTTQLESYKQFMELLEKFSKTMYDLTRAESVMQRMEDDSEYGYVSGGEDAITGFYSTFRQDSYHPKATTLLQHEEPKMSLATTNLRVATVAHFRAHGAMVADLDKLEREHGKYGDQYLFPLDKRVRLDNEYASAGEPPDTTWFPVPQGWYHPGTNRIFHQHKNPAYRQVDPKYHSLGVQFNIEHGLRNSRAAIFKSTQGRPRRVDQLERKSRGF